MPSLPSIAVVIPLHNGASWIRDTLDAALAQTHSPVEILVVDDRSTDDGPARAAAVPGVTVLDLPLPSVGGAGPGRHYGFVQTTAPFVAFLDQDDLWHPDHLRLLATALVRRSDCPAAVARFCSFTDSQSPCYDPPRLDLTTMDPWSDFPLNAICSPSGVLVRRSALAAAGGWPTTLPVTDFLTWFRLSLDHPFVENRCVSYAKRAHPASISTVVRDKRRASDLQRHAALVTPLLARRVQRHPDQAGRLRRRVRSLRAIGLLAAAYDGRSTASLSTAASTLESLARTEPVFFTRLLGHLFLYHLRADFQGSISEQTSFLEVFLSSWSPSAPVGGEILRSLFVQSLSVLSFVSFLWRHPLQHRAWQLGLAAARRWLRTRRPR